MIGLIWIFVFAEKSFISSGSWYTDQLSQFTGPLAWAAAGPTPLAAMTPPATAAVPRRKSRRETALSDCWLIWASLC